MASVRIDKVSKTFGQVQALSEVSLEILDGELMVLLGPSGCGKTTLLRAVAGLEDVSRGDVHIDDRCVNDIAANRRNAAMVFQNYALYPNLTVYENIAFPLRTRKVERSTIDMRVRATAQRIGITDFLARRPRQLSGGQRQRVAIARAVVREPQVFLLDEPMSNLDAQLRSQMRAELMRLQRELRTTTILVTHDQVEAMTMGDRITVMSTGTIQQTGTPAEIYHRPANTFVAGFIGSPPMNLAPARLAMRAGEMGLALPGTGWIPLPHDHRLGLRQGDDVTVGIRPEDLTIARSGDGIIMGQIDLIEYLGSETIAVVVSGTQEWVIKQVGTPQVALNQPTQLTAAEDRIHLFDASTTRLMGTLAQWSSGNRLSGLNY